MLPGGPGRLSVHGPFGSYLQPKPRTTEAWSHPKDGPENSPECDAAPTGPPNHPSALRPDAGLALSLTCLTVVFPCDEFSPGRGRGPPWRQDSCRMHTGLHGVTDQTLSGHRGHLSNGCVLGAAFRLTGPTVRPSPC